VFLFLFVASSLSQTCEDDDEVTALYQSNDMDTVDGSIEVSIPIDVLWSFFNQPSNWPIWSWGYASVDADSVELCTTINIQFNTYAHLPFTLPSSCKVYNVTFEDDIVAVYWSYSAIGLFGVHQQTLQKLSEDTSTYSNWEKADGLVIKSTSSIWENQFAFIQQMTLNGLTCLETVYQNTGYLDISDVKASCSPPPMQ